MHPRYDSIRIILSSEGINNPFDVNKLKKTDGIYISSNDYPWVKYLYSSLCDCHTAARTTLTAYGRMEGQYFQINGLNSLNKNHLSKFSCFFPGRTIVAAGDIKKKGDEYLVETKVVSNFLLSNIIAENDIGFFTPKSINQVIFSSFGASSDDYQIAELDRVATGIGDGFMTNPLVNNLYLGLPWLYNARPEDYIELLNKNENEFEKYNCYIRELSKSATSAQQLTEQLVKEFNDLRVDMNAKLDEVKDNLRRKGIITVTGMCLTALPVLDNTLFSNCDPRLLSSLIGGPTLYESSKLLEEVLSLNRVPKTHPLWIIWKWSKTKPV